MPKLKNVADHHFISSFVILKRFLTTVGDLLHPTIDKTIEPYRIRTQVYISGGAQADVYRGFYGKQEVAIKPREQFILMKI